MACVISNCILEEARNFVKTRPGDYTYSYDDVYDYANNYVY
jgi:hypothetical protein